MKLKIFVAAILLCVFMALSFGGCRKMKYPPGIDTVKSFGDGRFSICSMSGDTLALFDAENQMKSLLFVYNYNTKGNQLFVSSEEDTFVLVNCETGGFTQYKDFNSIPDNYKKEFSKIRLFKKYLSTAETKRSYGDGRFQIIRIKEGTFLHDMEKQEDVLADVYRWSNVKNGNAFITSKAGESVLLNYETGIYKKYEDVNSVPTELKFYLSYEIKKNIHQLN